jgi:hypothetical protein
MFNFLKRRPKACDFEASVSPEADAFLAEARAEFNPKQDAMESQWRFDDATHWNFQQETGLFKMDFEDGSQWQADGQILGSYSPQNKTWEWSWHNPTIEESIARASHKVGELGERWGIDYLRNSQITLPDEKYIAYLCAVGIKANNASGVYQADANGISVYILLSNFRWTKTANG